MRAVPTQADVAGETTLRGVLLNQEQRLLLVALAESRLRSDGLRPSTLPASKEAAGRLGWTVTKFNRKLDHLCQVLTKSGVRGLHGGPGELASQRRARLVQHAIASGMVTAEHLSLLP